MCNLAQEIILGTELCFVTLSARYIPGKKNVLMDQLSHPDQVLPMEWSLRPMAFDAICQVFDRPFMDLFANHANAKLPLYVSPVPNLMTWKQDVFQQDDLHAYTFPSLALLQVLSRVRLSR